MDSRQEANRINDSSLVGEGAAFAWGVARVASNSYRRAGVWVDGFSLACVVCYAAMDFLRRQVVRCGRQA